MKYTTLEVFCPKHGNHTHTLSSTIPGHEGAWCMMCWLESLGPSLPYKSVVQEIELGKDSNIPPEDLT